MVPSSRMRGLVIVISPARSDDNGSDDNGSDDHGSDDHGSDDSGSDENGSDDHGSDDSGSDDNGSDDPLTGQDPHPGERDCDLDEADQERAQGGSRRADQRAARPPGPNGRTQLLVGTCRKPQLYPRSGTWVGGSASVVLDPVLGSDLPCPVCLL